MAQRKLPEGTRQRISVSLDPEDFDWIQGFNNGREIKLSDSYLVARVVRAARLAGLTLDQATSGGVLEDFRDFLGKKRKSQLARELHELLEEFLDDR